MTPFHGARGVKGWRADLMSRFQPLLPEPGVPISGTGLSSAIMRLAHGSPGRIGYAGDR